MLRKFWEHLRARAAAWFERRSPWRRGPVSLHRKRIYILPTRGGLYFSLLLFAMLMGSMNYSNSLGFTLTFLLAGMALVCMHHTHRNLLNLSLRELRPEPVFAGGDARFPIALANPTRTTRYAVRVGRAGEPAAATVDVAAGGETRVQVAVPAPRRGRLAMPRLRVETEFPMGLFRAWSWVALELDCLVYPEPKGGRGLPPARPGLAEGDQGLHSGREDFAGLRRYVAGDPPRLIHWKAYPHSGALMVKQFTDPREQELWLDWSAPAGPGDEARLSQLARWVLDAERAGLAYGLRLPGETIPPDSGTAHRDRCLAALALFGDVR